MKLNPARIHEKLSHLTEEQIEELCRRYETGETNKSLIKEYNIDIYVSGLNKLLPLKITKEECIYCKKPLWAQRCKPNSYANVAFCYECGHNNTRYCTCDNCTEAKRLQQEKRAQNIFQLIKNRFGSGENKRSFSELNDKELIYLSCFVRAADTESKYTNISFHNCSFKLSPNRFFDNQIIQFLIDASLIFMVSLPQHYNEIIKTDSDLDKLDLFACHYSLNITDEQIDKDEIFKSFYYPKQNNVPKETLRKIWMNIAKHECLEYVITMVEDININYWFTEKHLEHIEEILRNFSVSQFYCMYYSCLKSATYNQIKNRWSNRETLHKSVVYTLNQAESAINNGWEIRKYNRNTERSTFSDIFFNLFLKIDKSGFYECPTNYQITD